MAGEDFVNVAQRAAAKKEKNYARADEIRAEPSAMGVTLKDTPQRNGVYDRLSRDRHERRVLCPKKRLPQL